MAKGTSDVLLESTSPIDAVFGAYDLGRFRIPYLSCVLTVQQCTDYLSLAGDDPAFTLANGKVEELFQRDIDEERVAEMAKQYLNPDVATRPAFFNSLTVALLVKDANESSAPLKLPQDVNNFSKDYGPIRVSWEREGTDQLPKLGSFGCIYWNKLGAHAVAIDGQHRLAALKRLGSQNNLRAKKLGVSIIFLVLDERFGVRADKKPPVELMRQLFIDLNKHAQKVSRARQLLLDDLDPMAIALRRTLGPELNYEAAAVGGDLPIGKNGEFSTCLPLELVDWHGEQRAKVDSGPYATSVLALEWAIVCLCESKRVTHKVLPPSSFYAESFTASDTEEGGDERDYYAKVKQLLKEWLKHIPSLAQEIELAKTNDFPFSLSAASLLTMGKLIHAQWGEALTCLFSRAGPYHRLAKYRVKNNLLNAKFGTWYQADQAAAAAVPAAKKALQSRLDGIKAELANSDEHGLILRFGNCVKEIQNEIKAVSTREREPESHLLFFLTGQRSMVLALRWLFDIGMESAAGAKKLAAALGRPMPTTLGEEATFFATALSEAINHWDSVDGGIVFTKAVRCMKCGRFPPNFWQGSILKRESSESVDFSGIAAERGARVLYLLAAAWMYRKLELPDPTRAIHQWCKTGQSVQLLTLENSPAGRHLKRALINTAGFDQFGSPGHEANKFPFVFLSKMKLGDDADYTADEHRALVQNRVDWIWKHAKSAH